MIFLSESLQNCCRHCWNSFLYPFLQHFLRVTYLIQLTGVLWSGNTDRASVLRRKCTLAPSFFSSSALWCCVIAFQTITTRFITNVTELTQGCWYLKKLVLRFCFIFHVNLFFLLSQLFVFWVPIHRCLQTLGFVSVAALKEGQAALRNYLAKCQAFSSSLESTGSFN